MKPEDIKDMQNEIELRNKQLQEIRLMLGLDVKAEHREVMIRLYNLGKMAPNPNMLPGRYYAYRLKNSRRYHLASMY